MCSTLNWRGAVTSVQSRFWIGPSVDEPRHRNLAYMVPWKVTMAVIDAEAAHRPQGPVACHG